MRRITVRKGITTDPLVWGLTIHFFYLFLLMIGLTAIISMAVIGLSAMNSSMAGVVSGLIILGVGLLVSLITRNFLKKFSGSKKTVFGKKVITIANDDILSNL